MLWDIKSTKQINPISNLRRIVYILTKYHKVLSIDLIEPLLESTGYDSILVVVDCFSKMAHYIPINMNITTQEVAKVL